MIHTLKHEYGRIGLLKSIYRDKKMQECVAEVYRLGNEFLQEATVYYSYTTSKRLWYVLAQPPEINLKAKVSEIQAAITELVEQRDTLDRIRLGRVENKIDFHFERMYLLSLVYQRDFSIAM